MEDGTALPAAIQAYFMNENIRMRYAGGNEPWWQWQSEVKRNPEFNTPGMAGKRCGRRCSVQLLESNSNESVTREHRLFSDAGPSRRAGHEQGIAGHDALDTSLQPSTDIMAGALHKSSTTSTEHGWSPVTFEELGNLPAPSRTSSSLTHLSSHLVNSCPASQGRDRGALKYAGLRLSKSSPRLRSAEASQASSTSLRMAATATTLLQPESGTTMQRLLGGASVVRRDYVERWPRPKDELKSVIFG